MKLRFLFLIALLGCPLAYAQPPSPPEVEGLSPALEAPEDLPPPPPLPDPLSLEPDKATGRYCLTAAQAVQRAWQENPDVKAADSRIRQAYWAVSEAGSPPNASLGLGSWQGKGEALINGNYINSLQGDYYLYLTQPFRPLGTLSTNRSVAFRDFTQAQAAAAQTRIQLAQKVKDAYYNVMASEQQWKVAQQNLELAEQVLKITEIRFEKGSGPRLDRINATIQCNRTRQDLVLARGQFRQASARLASLLGLPAQAEIETSGHLEPPAGNFLYEALMALARQHPRLLAAQEALVQSQFQRKLAEQQANPIPGISAIYDLVKPSYLVQLTLSIPIDWGAIRNDVRQKEEVEIEKQHLLESERLALSSDLKASFEAYQSAYENASNYLETVLKPSEESARITEYGYKRGALPFLQLLTMQQQLTSVRKDYIDRQLAVHLALDALEATVGQQLEENKP